MRHAAWLLALLIYLPTLANGFIRDNDTHLGTPGWLDRVGVAQAFVDNSWHVVYDARYYRPLVLASHKLDAALFGTQAWGLHLTNVLIYAALCALLVACLAELGCAPLPATVLGVLFAAHPAHAECVAWISGRSDLMAALAGGAALLAAWRGRAAWAGVWLLASMLSKEVGAAYALTIGLAALATRNRALGLATLAAALVYAGLRATALGSPGVGGGLPGSTEAALMAVLAVKMAGRYLAMLVTGATWGAFSWDEVVARHHLLGTPDLSAHLALELDGELLWALAALVGARSAVAWLRRGAGGRATLALVLAASSLALSFTAVRFADKLNFADRYVFVPSFALALALGMRVASLNTKACAVAAVVCVAWTACASERSARYRDPVSFAEGAVRDNPLSGIAWQMLAHRRHEAGDAVGAWDAKLRALALHGELVASFDVKSGRAPEAYATAVINAARWRNDAAMKTLAEASAREKANRLDGLPHRSRPASTYD